MRTLCLLLLCSIVLFKATGQAGSLDSTFGNNGIQMTTFLDNANLLYEEGRVVLTNANGDIFVVARVNFSYTRIAKYLPDGRLDSSYGNAGYSNAANLRVYSATLQGDKIIVAGGDFALARYTADGSLDSTFGVNGKVTTDFGGDGAFANAIALQGDKIIVAGEAYPVAGNNDFALARYMANGTLDSSFGVNGKVITDFNNNSYDRATAVALQGDKIIAAGEAYFNYWDFALARYTADGKLDSSFGVNGLVTTDFKHSDEENYSDDDASAITLQGDKILVAGSSYVEWPSSDFALARYTADGSLDSSFGVNGEVLTDFGGYDEANAIALQGDKIVVAGSAFVRYTTNGTLDSSFGENGIVATSFGVNAIALQGEKIVVAGGTEDFAVARYTTNGTLDSSFGEHGLLTGHFPTSQTYFTSTVIQGNKIIVAGSALVRYKADGILDSSFGVNGRAEGGATAIAIQGDKILVIGSGIVRYTADGVLDSSFGVNGIATLVIGTNAIALQGDKIIVAGSIRNDRYDDFALARYTADGKLDSTFGGNGIVTTDFGGDDYANAMVLQGDKIIATEYTNNPYDPKYNTFALARYTTNGALDFSVTNDFYATSIALQGDKIIVAGTSNEDFALARYTADGTLDSTFGVNGKVTTDFNNSNDIVNAIAIQGDKIIAGGGSMLVRYTADGNLDSSFGVNGIAITGFGVNAIALHENRLYAVGSLGTSSPYETYGVIAAYQLEATEPTVSIADVTVSESKKFAVVTVSLSAPATKWVRVHYTTRDKTALFPQDYLSVQGTLLFIPGVNTIFKIRIPLVDDNVCEPTEQFEVLLTNAHNATLQDSIGVVTITDDDNALITKQSASLHIHASPNPSTNAFTVQLQGTNVKQPISIRVYDISGRLLEERDHISLGQSLRLGDQYKAGTYIIEARQGTHSVQTKVIKTGQ